MNGFGWINANDVQQKELKHLLSTSILLGHLLLWPWRLSGKWAAGRGVGVLMAPQIQLHSSLAGNLNFHRPPVKCPASDFGLGTGLIQPASYPWPSRCHACLVATPPFSPSSSLASCHSRSAARNQSCWCAKPLLSGLLQNSRRPVYGIALDKLLLRPPRIQVEVKEYEIINT